MAGLLTGRLAVVTGASSGIGLATARALAREGAEVVLAARRMERLKGEVAALRREGFRAHARSLDVSRARSCERFVERVLGEGNELDILVNNAGRLLGVFAEHRPRRFSAERGEL